MADGNGKIEKVKEELTEVKSKMRKWREKAEGKSKLHPIAGAGITILSGTGLAYIDGRASSDANKHPASLLAIGGGVVATIAASALDKPSYAHAAVDFTAGPATVVLADMARRKGMAHAASAPSTTKAPATATAAG